VPEWPRALKFVARRLRVRVQPIENARGLSDISPAESSGHAISMRTRTLYFDRGDAEQTIEWVHEVAHLHLTPPWGTLETTSEWPMIFPWELAVVTDLYGRRLVTMKQVEDAADVLGEYVCGDRTTWSGMSPAIRDEALAKMRATCVQAGVLTRAGAPTWLADPTWSRVDGGRWDEVGRLLADAASRSGDAVAATAS
jgi:hypothetical protein